MFSSPQFHNVFHAPCALFKLRREYPIHCVCICGWSRAAEGASAPERNRADDVGLALSVASSGDSAAADEDESASSDDGNSEEANGNGEEVVASAVSSSQSAQAFKTQLRRLEQRQLHREQQLEEQRRLWYRLYLRSKIGNDDSNRVCFSAANF